MLQSVTGRIVYSCPFVPAEWIAAHGFQPSRVMPSVAQIAPRIGIGAGVCPFARAFINLAISDVEAAGVIVTTVCDQMRRAAEIIALHTRTRVFLLNVPSTWETVGAQKLYLSELERLGRFLTRLGGEPPSDGRLAQAMRKYDGMRTKVKDARGTLSPRAYSEMIARFHRDASNAECPTGPTAASGHDRIPLAFVGGPLLVEHFRFFDLIEASGGHVALDATETGERTLPARFDRRRLSEDPLSELADAYFGTIPDVARRPNSELYRWLKRELAEREVRGIIYVRYLWCDLWHAEAQRMKEWLGLPFFDLDITEDTSDEGRRLTRFGAFMEMLR